MDFVAEQLIAGAAAGGFFLLAAVAYPRGMGMGDVKLAGVMGLYLGRAVGLAVLVGLVAGVVIGAVIISRLGAKEGRKAAIPFGPFLALGGIVAIFAGDAVADSYADRF
jgi:leader peptidase (prepilin peptidase)/N-methyltransferase